MRISLDHRPFALELPAVLAVATIAIALKRHKVTRGFGGDAETGNWTGSMIVRRARRALPKA